jgi:signal peptidase I
MTRATLSILKLFVVATVIALSVRLLFLENYHIISNSMLPNLLSGDIVFVNKMAFNFRLPFSSYELVKFKRPIRSEVIAFSLPDRGIDTFVKRVVAIEGDRVEIKNGKLFINNAPVSYAPVSETRQRDLAALSSPEGGEWLLEHPPQGNPYLIQFEKTPTEHYGPVDVPKNHFFAMGDNRNDSIDSRVWGPVPYSCLKGKVGVVWWSTDPSGIFRRNRTAMRVN